MRFSKKKYSSRLMRAPTVLSSSNTLIAAESEHSSSSSETALNNDPKLNTCTASLSLRVDFEPSGSSCDTDTAVYKRGNVRFKSVKVRKTLSRTHYTQAEKERYWWTHTEYQAMEESRAKLIRMFEGAGSSKQHLYVRGLENQVRSSALLRSHNRKEAWQAVLSEQEKQRAMGACDPGALAECYQEVSARCQRWARGVAFEDQQATQQEKDDCVDETLQRRVRFNGKVQVRTALNRSQYSKEEIANYWFSQFETESIREACAKEVQTRDGTSRLSMEEASDSCLRGLESYTPEGRHARSRLRKQAYRAVLLGSTTADREKDPDAVEAARASRYQNAAAPAHRFATEAGLRDRREADLVYAEQKRSPPMALSVSVGGR